LAYWLTKKEYGEHLLQKGDFKVNASKAWIKWKKEYGEHLVKGRTFRGWFNKKHPFELSKEKQDVLDEDLCYLK